MKIVVKRYMGFCCWDWTLVASNGVEVGASTQTFDRKSDALRSAKSVGEAIGKSRKPRIEIKE